jgi:hypothetical protein
MSSWVFVIAETGEAPDFWAQARAAGVEPWAEDVPPHVLVECPGEFGVVESFARELSRAVGRTCVACAAQTSADAYGVWVYRGGEPLRQLTYSRDDGGWRTSTGTPQDWEGSFFFEEDDMVDDEVADEDRERLERARAAGDATSVLDLLHPSSSRPFQRLCRAHGVDPDEPHARWQRPSILMRIFGRSA